MWQGGCGGLAGSQGAGRMEKHRLSALLDWASIHSLVSWPPVQQRAQVQPESAMSARETAAALGVPFVEDLAERTPAAEFIAAIPIAFARRHLVLGLAGDNGRITVALGDPANWEQLQVVSRFLNKPVTPI